MAVIGQHVKKSKGRTCPFNSWLKMGTKYWGLSTVPSAMVWFNWRATTRVVPFVVAKMAKCAMRRPRVIRLLNSFASMKMSNRQNRASVDVSAFFILFLSLGGSNQSHNPVLELISLDSIKARPNNHKLCRLISLTSRNRIFTIHKYTLMNQE